MCQRFRALYLYNSYFFDVCKVFFGKIICFARPNGGQTPTKRGRCREKKETGGICARPGGPSGRTAAGKTRNLPGIYPAQQSAARCTTGAGSAASQSSANTRSVSSHKETPLVRMCFFPVYTPAGQKGRGNLPSCKLHLDFRRRIRYNIYVIHTTEYAGVSEWQTRGTQNPLRDFSCLCKKFTSIR